MFWSGVPLGGHLTSSCCAPPDTGVSDLQLVALERLLSIEGADEIRIDVTFLRGKAPLPGADSPYQGEMSRRDKRGRDAGSAQPRLRGCRRFAIKPKPQIQFAVWKGRNEHRGKETSLAAARSVVVISDAPPAAPSFPSCRKRRGRKGALGYGWVCPASEFRRGPMFQASFHSIVTSRASWYAPPDTWGHQVCN